MTIASIVATGNGAVSEYDDPAAARDAAGVTWVRATEATTGELERIADVFGLHPLAIETIEEGNRAKTERFRTHTFVLFKTATLAADPQTFADEIGTEPIGLFVGDDWLVTLSTAQSRPTDRVWRVVTNGGGERLDRGPAFIACRVIDTIVEEYYDVLYDLESEIEGLEERVASSPDADVIEALSEVRRDLLSFRKLVWPARSAVGALLHGEGPRMGGDTERYYRDVYDDLAQLVTLVETYRDLIRGTRDVYLNTLSQSTNDVMKTLTVVATIVLPLTLIAGIYGMNFRVMPELRWEYGYPAVLLGMALIALLSVLYFERRGYL